MGHNKINLKPYQFYALRTPLLPFKTLSDTLNDDTDNSLKNCWKLDSVRHAIYISSTSLYNELNEWVDGNLKNDPKKLEKLKKNFLKYLVRMSTRCTPYGLMAGISVGRFDDQSNITIKSESDYDKVSRLDMGVCAGLIGDLLNQKEVFNKIKFYPNNTIYRVGDYFRYVESKVCQKNHVSPKFVSVEFSEYLSEIFNLAKPGATIKELANALVDEDISIDEASEFIVELYENGLLISELHPHVTNYNPISKINKTLAKYNIVNDTTKELKQIEQELILLTNSSFEEGLNKSKKIISHIDNLSESSKNYLQIDLSKPLENIDLNKSIYDELSESLKVLMIDVKEENSDLNSFKEAFYQRYEDAEVPLNEALDPDFGLGFPVNKGFYEDTGNLLKNLTFPSGVASSNTTRQTPWIRFIKSKYLEANQKNLREVNLTDKEIEKFIPDQLPVIPTSMYTIASVYADSHKKMDEGDYLLSHNLTSGPSISTILGRFCHLNEDLTNNIKEVISDEESQEPDKIFVEIIHLTEGRLGNIVFRPVLRDYEVPIIERSQLADDQVITVDDIMVSMKANKIILRSKKHNKEIVPRMSNAHNYMSANLPYYSFLAALKCDNQVNDLTWENYSRYLDFPYSPRVVFSKTILAKAKWNFVLPKEFRKKKANTLAVKNWLLAEIQEKNVDSNITYVDKSSNPLFLNLKNGTCIDILVESLIKNFFITLEEVIFNDKNLIVKDVNNNSFNNELIIPVGFPRAIAKSQISITPSSKEVQRTFIPGSKWSYFKIYCSANSSDKVLLDYIKPLINELKNKGLIDKWFFLRYGDPDHHLRVRVLSKHENNQNISSIINRYLQKLIDNKLSYKVIFDTYNRELERYGAHNIENSEDIFQINSDLVLTLLANLSQGNDDQKWLFAIKGVDEILNSFNLSLELKRDVMESISLGFLGEFGLDSTYGKKQLSEKYRGSKKSIEEILMNNYEIFSQTRSITQPIISKINELKSNGILSKDIPDLIGSYAHMFLNRYFNSNQRKKETVIYDMLHQYYRSLYMRQKYESSNKNTVKKEVVMQ